MLIVSDEIHSLEEINFIDAQLITKAYFSKFSEIREHKLRPINYELIILLPGLLDISYHLKYLRLSSDATIILITSKEEYLSKNHRDNVFCFKPGFSKEFFSGCLTTLIQKRKTIQNDSIDFIHTLNTGKFSLSSIQQVVLVSKAIARACNNTPQVRRGVYELLLNAFEHGVYQLGFELKKELIANKKYFAELNKRIHDPAFKNKNIELIIHKKEDGTYININDPGLGFDHQPYVVFNKDLSSSETGRGISYAATYCFDQLIYKNDGRSVFAVLRNIN